MSQKNKVKSQDKEALEVRVSHTAERILGIIGGLSGILGALFALLIGGIGTAFRAEGVSNIVNLAWVAMLLSIVGLISGAAVSRNPEVAGVLMVVCGVGGVLAISFGYVIAGPFLIIGGILALAKDDKN